MGSNPRQAKEICGTVKYFFVFTQQSSMPCFELRPLETAARRRTHLTRKQQFSTEANKAIAAARCVQSNKCHHIEFVKFVEKPLQLAREAI